MIKFPSILGEWWKRHHQPRNGMARARHPAIMIDAAIAKHFEVLSCMCLLRFRIVERVNHRRAIKGFLHGSVNALGKWQTRCFQDSRRNVGYMSELGTNFPLAFNSRRPMDHGSVSCAAVVR